MDNNNQPAMSDMNHQPITTTYNNQVPLMDNNNQQSQQQPPYQVSPPLPINQQLQQQPPATMTDVKQPFTNDIKQQPIDTMGNNDVGNYSGSKVPDYEANTSGLTPMQKEQQQLQQQQQQANLSSGYPGVVGGTPAESQGVAGYDAQGNPIIPPFIAQRHQIEQSLGATCPKGGYHDLRMLLSNSSLLVAILIVPYCCGYRGRREVSRLCMIWYHWFTKLSLL
jgi:hypothetical protein